MKNLRFLIIGAFICIVFFTSCADDISVVDCVDNQLYGFWYGFWHGLVILFSLIGSLFNDDIAVYAINNNGGWYDFGFVMGLSCSISSTYSKTSK